MHFLLVGSYSFAEHKDHKKLTNALFSYKFLQIV